MSSKCQYFHDLTSNKLKTKIKSMILFITCTFTFILNTRVIFTTFIYSKQACTYSFFIYKIYWAIIIKSLWKIALRYRLEGTENKDAIKCSELFLTPLAKKVIALRWLRIPIFYTWTSVMLRINGMDTYTCTLGRLEHNGLKAKTKSALVTSREFSRVPNKGTGSVARFLKG